MCGLALAVRLLHLYLYLYMWHLRCVCSICTCTCTCTCTCGTCGAVAPSGLHADLIFLSQVHFLIQDSLAATGYSLEIREQAWLVCVIDFGLCTLLRLFILVGDVMLPRLSPIARTRLTYHSIPDKRYYNLTQESQYRVDAHQYDQTAAMLMDAKFRNCFDAQAVITYANERGRMRKPLKRDEWMNYFGQIKGYTEYMSAQQSPQERADKAEEAVKQMREEMKDDDADKDKDKEQLLKKLEGKAKAHKEKLRLLVAAGKVPEAAEPEPESDLNLKPEA